MRIRRLRNWLLVVLVVVVQEQGRERLPVGSCDQLWNVTIWLVTRRIGVKTGRMRNRLRKIHETKRK